MNKELNDILKVMLTDDDKRDVKLTVLAAWIQERQRCKRRIEQADKVINGILSEIS